MTEHEQATQDNDFIRETPPETVAASVEPEDVGPVEPEPGPEPVAESELAVELLPTPESEPAPAAIFEPEPGPGTVQMVEPAPSPKPGQRRFGRSRTFFYALSLLVTFALGLGSGVLMSNFIASQPGSVAEAGVVDASVAEAGAATSADEQPAESAVSELTAAPQHQAPLAFTLPVSYRTLGPDMIEAGVIDYDKFVGVYQQRGRPLSDEQLAFLEAGGDAPITLNLENAYFLLNFFWALGLVNQNPILTEGAMMQYGGEDQIGRFASTGGWSIGGKAPTELYASALLVELTPEQQARLEEVAQNVYRPCCNNHTAFPDCNHGMAMLGLLELMAAEDASADSMYEAAKWANAFWFPQQSQELATYFRVAEGQSFDEIDGQQAVSAKFFSGSGFKGMHDWLSTNGQLEQAPSSGGSCGV